MSLAWILGFLLLHVIGYCVAWLSKGLGRGDWSLMVTLWPAVHGKYRYGRVGVHPASNGRLLYRDVKLNLAWFPHYTDSALLRLFARCVNDATDRAPLKARNYAERREADIYRNKWHKCHVSLCFHLICHAVLAKWPVSRF